MSHDAHGHGDGHGEADPSHLTEKHVKEYYTNISEVVPHKLSTIEDAFTTPWNKYRTEFLEKNGHDKPDFILERKHLDELTNMILEQCHDIIKYEFGKFNKADDVHKNVKLTTEQMESYLRNELGLDLKVHIKDSLEGKTIAEARETYLGIIKNAAKRYGQKEQSRYAEKLVDFYKGNRTQAISVLGKMAGDGYSVDLDKILDPEHFTSAVHDLYRPKHELEKGKSRYYKHSGGHGDHGDHGAHH